VVASMIGRIAAAVIPLSFLGAATDASELPAFAVGKHISTALLQELTDPARTGYRIGIVNTGPATGILLHRTDSPVAIEYVDGADSFLWAQAADQLPSVRLEDRLHFRVDRRKFDASACPGLPALITAFQAELDAVVSRHVSVTSPSPAKYRTTGPNGLEEIALDGTRFFIQVSLADATLVITPDTGSDPPLQQATGMLHSVLSRCANSVKPEMEEHDF